MAVAEKNDGRSRVVRDAGDGASECGPELSFAEGRNGRVVRGHEVSRNAMQSPRRCCGAGLHGESLQNSNLYRIQNASGKSFFSIYFASNVHRAGQIHSGAGAKPGNAR